MLELFNEELELKEPTVAEAICAIPDEKELALPCTNDVDKENAISLWDGEEVEYDDDEVVEPAATVPKDAFPSPVKLGSIDDQDVAELEEDDDDEEEEYDE